jgi:hypothetical protein
MSLTPQPIRLFLIFSLFLCAFVAKSQPISGTKTVCTSGCDYPSLTAAVAALNINGVGTGGAIIEIANGHTETSPNAGLSLGSTTLNASLNASNPLIIRKSLTAGAKPIITSGAGTGAMDAMLRLIGVDYVTLENLVFNEAIGNVTSTNLHEYGIAMLKRNSASPVDGCQFTTIIGCDINFRRSSTLTQIGIYAGNHIASNTSVIFFSTFGDTHSSNTIVGNSVVNAQHGIYFAGTNWPPSVWLDQNNTIGIAGNGNRIVGFGPNSSVAASGISAFHQTNLSVEANTISGGGLLPYNNGISGVHLQYIFRAFVKGNTISDTSLSGSNIGLRFQNNLSGTRLYIDSNRINYCYATEGVLNAISATMADSLFITRNAIHHNHYLGTGTNNFSGLAIGGPGIGNLAKSLLIKQNEIFANKSTANLFGINLSGTDACLVRVYDNSIHHDTCTIGQNIGIMNSINTNLPDSILRNEIYELRNTIGGSITGYFKPTISSSNTNVKVIEANKIYNLRCFLGSAKGIEFFNHNGPVWIKGNEIYGLRSDSIFATLTGIEIGTGGFNVYIVNNLIYDFQTYNSPIVGKIHGIYINNAVSNNTSRIYHNTVFFDASNSGNLESYCLRAGIFSQVEVRNNVFVNKSLATLNGFNAAYYREGSNLATYRIGSNHNLFFSSGTPGRFALFFDAVTKDSTLAQLKNKLAPRESNSYFENVVFQQTSIQPFDLRPAALLATLIESGASIIDTPITVYTDINGVQRTKRYPDLGCYEGNFLISDSIKPGITYGKVQPVTPYMPAPQISAFVTDRFGIKVATANRPRLYFKKKTDANAFIGNTNANGGWKFVLTTDSISPFNFQVNYSLLQSALVPGDTIEFFATAEDSNNNVGAGTVILFGNPSATTLTASNFPVAGQLNFFPVFDTLSGTFTVGNGGNFNSLTAALRRFEASVQTGPVTLLLTNTIYTTPAFGGLETFPLSLRASIGMSNTNTLLIKPALGVSSLIFGSFDSALFVVRDGVIGFTFDGSNANSSSRNVSLHNTHNNGQSVIFIQSNNTNGGVKNVEFKNLNLKGGNMGTTQIVIIGARTGIGPQAIVKASGADRITLRNSNLYFGLSGLMAIGSATSPINNLLIEGNRFSTDSSILNLTGTGIYIEGVTNGVINKNTIRNMFTQFVTIVSGITLSDNVSNTSIKNNIIDNIESANNNSTGCYGISISSSVGINNDSVYNNSISRIISSTSGNGFGNVFNRIEGGTNIKVLYNSVHLSGGSFFGSGANGSGAMQIFGSGPFTGLEIRNNIFSNIVGNPISGSRNAAIWVSTTLPIAGAVINHNNYFANNLNGVLLTSGLSSFNTLAELQSVLGGNSNSISTNPLFISNSNLRPGKGGLLRIGSVIPIINRDLLDSVRSNTLTRIGCYENEYDVHPPVFGSHQNATNSGASPLRTLEALTITDTLSGINIANGRRPRVYFKKKSEGNGFGLNQSSVNGWKFVESANNASPFTFTLNYALLTSLPIVGDSIYYFFVAADSAGNYAALPSLGFASVSMDSLLTPPTNPFRFRIVAPPLAGVYRVGTGGNFTTLTTAINDLHQRGVSAPVTFLLTQTTYAPPTESFPFTFSNLIQGVSATNTISIRPANGVQVSIAGSGSPAIFNLNGCSFININGSDTLSNAGRKITIRNTTGGACVLLENDASFNQVRNSILYSDPFLNSDGIVKFGNRLLTGNDNNVIDSCLIGAFSPTSRPSVCISANATTGPSQALSSNNIISNNEIANPNNFGILIDNDHENFSIIGNSFYKNANYTHAGNFSFIRYSANGCFIANNFFGGSAANCGGALPTLFDGTSGTFSLMNLQGLDIIVRQNTFRRIQFTGLFNNSNHALIGVLNGKFLIQDNILGSDTGLASIQINYTNPVATAGFSAINIGSSLGSALDSVQLINNRIGAMQAMGGGLLNLYGIRFNASSGNFIARNNLIGSNQTLGSISLACNGDLMGIEFTVNNGQHVLLENNTIRNLQYTLHHSKAVTGIFHSGNTPAIIRNNVVQQLYHLHANATLINTGFNFLNGIFMSASGAGQRLITGNRITQIHTNGIPSGGATGIQISGTGIEVSRNSVFGIGPLATTEARARGIYSFGNDIQLNHNEVALGADSNSNANTANIAYQGIIKNGTTNKIFYNTVRISGNNVSNTGSSYTAAYLSEVGDAQDSVFNNIFINERSNSSAAGSKHYSAYFWFGSNPIMNRNLLFTNGLNGFIGNASSTDYSTLAAFAAATNTNANSRSKQVQFVSPWNLRLAGTSLGDTALVGLPIPRLRLDIDNQLRDPFKPYMGCDEALSHPLPVVLTMFEVYALERDARIIWQTSSELNCNGYYLERSFDGVNFEAIAFYEGKGNTNTLTNYQHLDKDILMANSSIYYKLIQEDIDGTKRILGVRLILSNEVNQHLILVYPNPTSDYIWIKGPETASFEKIELYTLDGKLARNWDFLNLAAVTSILKLDVLGLSQGLYLLHMKIGNHNYVRKLNLN